MNSFSSFGRFYHCQSTFHRKKDYKQILITYIRVTTFFLIARNQSQTISQSIKILFVLIKYHFKIRNKILRCFKGETFYGVRYNYRSYHHDYVVWCLFFFENRGWKNNIVDLLLTFFIKEYTEKQKQRTSPGSLRFKKLFSIDSKNKKGFLLKICISTAKKTIFSDAFSSSQALLIQVSLKMNFFHVNSKKKKNI